MRPGGASRFPEKRPLHVPVRPPGPPVVAPVLPGPVPAVLDEVPVLAVRYHVLAGAERRDVDIPFPVFVVPPKGREVGGLAQVDRVRLDRDHPIGRVVDTLPRVRRRSCRPLATVLQQRRRMDGRPVLRFLDEVDRSFAEQHGTRFEVDTLVFVPHEERPHGMRLIDSDATSTSTVVEAFVRQNRVLDRLVHLLPVLVDLGNGRPQLGKRDS